ncbi:universal stress protein [Phascolarctobacterium faecium]|uniref:universal stress protein n=1 Tax=Phascolarctobacterium faecium TaxID=33025 RepID=UPI003FD6E1C3
MKKILVPFDGSETALRALEFAAGIGKPFGSEIMVSMLLYLTTTLKFRQENLKMLLKKLKWQPKNRIRLRLISLKVFWISWAALPHPIV